MAASACLLTTTTLSFAGLQDVELLFGIDCELELRTFVIDLDLFPRSIPSIYSLIYSVTVAATPSMTECNRLPECNPLPFVYTTVVPTIRLTACDMGLVAVNFTQLCFAGALQQHADLRQARRPCMAAVAARAAAVPVHHGSPACRLPLPAQAGRDRHGMECVAGYEGPLCGVCSPGYGKTSRATCSECYSRDVSAVIITIATVVSFIRAGSGGCYGLGGAGSGCGGAGSEAGRRRDRRL